MFVAEIGNNHKGSEKAADDFLNALLQTSVDAVTFQIREAPFYNHTTADRISLSDNFFKQAIPRCHKRNKKIGFAIADPAKVNFLHEAGADFWKTLSWDILNLELQKKLQATGKTVFISTGVSGIDEIVAAGKLHDNIKFIHTQLTYEPEMANLKAIRAMREATSKEVAFGSHCENKNIFFAALAFEPSDVFFYVKGDDGGVYPDDKHAVVLSQVEHLIQEMRVLQSSLGDGNKRAMKKNL
jgi:N-acetylneuraminate synthase